ncbi:rhomboid family intramembrane serine protease [Mucilaginibacter sp. 14171R-50]|uniref:rhomboid family intramembrane serine protease n=1 Tax=Mucilaginibacter sp. 14171R-50 TaxID=2703789 RepID=UPI00138D9110|nr:rhomboid family intramembrane serine protease [Mucilaginibacter sp. 14171R-50]QHS54392.1 rhomboid family intramembrane serine protease [Mucilaginibacter sp. 14171R-50]
MSWGISPRKSFVVPLNEYNADHYLTLVYHAFNNLGWHIGYFNTDGIIAYTNISWASYAEEVSVHIVNNRAIIKSECVGYQFYFTDYGKNEKNLDLLFGEITYVEQYLQPTLQETAQELMDAIPDRQFISFEDPPLGYKAKLRGFLSHFTPKPGYTITPILILTNIGIYFISTTILIAMLVAKSMQTKQLANPGTAISLEDIYLSVGFSGRTPVLHGQLWRLITNTFLHFSLLHIAGNMIVLIYIGSLIENKLGKWNYLFIYLLTGICASTTSVIWNEQGILAGASGAIFGLFGVLLALLTTNFYENNARKALLISTTIFIGYSIIPVGRNVDHAAHFGGLISGFIFGWVAYLGLRHQKKNLIAASALGITIMYTTLCIWLAPVYQFKELQQLTAKTDTLFSTLNNDFYRTTNLDRSQRLAMFNNKTLRRVDTLLTVVKKLNTLILPDKEKRVAVIKSKIIELECRLYKLLYKEFSDNDNYKYRAEITGITNSINELRLEWGKLEEKD